MIEPAVTENADQQATSPQLLFDREKWLAECVFRQQDIDLKKQEQARFNAELEFKLKESRRAWLLSPLVLAIIGAALAAFGNAGVSLVNAIYQRQLEEVRATSRA